MRRAAWSWLLCGCAAFAPFTSFTSFTSFTPPPEADDFESRLAAFDEAMAKVRDLRADFEQTKHTAMLKHPLVSRGTVVVRHDTVLWTTTEPRRSIMLVTPKELRLYDPEARVMEVYAPGASLEGLMGSPLARVENLRRHFAASALPMASFGDVEEADRHVSLVLRPLTDELKEFVAEVKVLLDARVPCLRRAIMVDPDGETTDIEFSNVRVNIGLKEEDVTLDVPPGTRIVRPLGGRERQATTGNRGSR